MIFAAAGVEEFGEADEELARLVAAERDAAPDLRR